MKYILTFCLLFNFTFIAFAQSDGVKGTIMDTNGSPIPFASIFVKNTSRGTSANSEGQYALYLPKGSYSLRFNAIGYRDTTFEMQISGIQNINIILKTANYELHDVIIKESKEDPAYEIIRNAIHKRKFYLNETESYTCDVYIKGLQRMLAAPKKFMGQDMDQIGRELGLDSNRRGIIYLSESESKLSFMNPGEFHEEVISSKVSGNNRAFTFNRATEINVNFYNNLQNWQHVSTRPMVSPIADNALSFYTYKWVGETVENGQTINKIMVIPRHKLQPAFEGYIYIMDESWRIYSVDLYLTKSAGLNFVDTLKVKQQYIPVESNTWMPSLTKFDFTASFFNFKLGGYFVAVYKNYNTNPGLNKRLFLETLRIGPEVNKKDSAYWQQTRPIPLTPEEETDYLNKQDLAQKRESPFYQDSIRKVHNKLTAGKILLNGVELTNKSGNSTFRFESLSSAVIYNTVEGVAINYGIRYSHIVDSLSGKRLQLSGNFQYGFSDHKFNSHFNAYIPSKVYQLGFGFGSEVTDLNNTFPITSFVNELSSLFYRLNYQKLYENHFASIFASRRITGGLTAGIDAEVADRSWLNNTSFYSFFYRDRKYTSNNPSAPDEEGMPLFNPSRSFKIHVTTSYDFSNKFSTGPGGKQYEGSSYPTIQLDYTKGIKNLFGSDVNYDLLKLNVSKNDVPLGLYGKFSFEIEGGKFLNAANINYIDYKHFMGDQTIFYKDFFNQFLLLNYYSYSTSNEYIEAHLKQNFGGALLSKIPLIRKLKLQELITYNYLTTPDFKNYQEVGVGLQYLSFKVLYGWALRSNNAQRSGIKLDLNF